MAGRTFPRGWATFDESPGLYAELLKTVLQAHDILSHPPSPNSGTLHRGLRRVSRYSRHIPDPHIRD